MLFFVVQAIEPTRIYESMSESAIIALAEQQEWLQPVQTKGQAWIKAAFQALGKNAATVKNILHGVPLGHPLHSAITDIPVGSWTTALVLDAMDAGGQKEYRAGADAAVALGLVGAVGAAVTGAADWSETHGKPQRLGALHGLINTAAALLYTGSYIARKTGNRSLGRTLGCAGFGFVFAGAFLGGELAYSRRVGVNHAPDPDEELPQEFVKVLRADELQEGKPRKATADRVDILLFKREGRIRALANTCAHAGGPLAEGKVVDGTIECPWHGSRFCLDTGSVVDGPATHPQPVLDVQVRDGDIWVKARR